MARKDPNFPMQGKRGGMGGTYGSKSTNLSKGTLRKAGAAKAAAKRTVSQSDTKRVGSRTLGPSGKPVTGTVLLADGSKAVYKDGRRVQAADARKSKPAASGGRSRPSTGQAGSNSRGSSASPGRSRAGSPQTASRPGGARSATSATVSGARAAGRAAGAGSGRSGSYTPGAGTGSRSATSPTVAAAVAAGNRRGPGVTSNVAPSRTQYTVPSGRGASSASGSKGLPGTNTRGGGGGGGGSRTTRPAPGGRGAGTAAAGANSGRRTASSPTGGVPVGTTKRTPSGILVMTAQGWRKK